MSTSHSAFTTVNPVSPVNAYSQETLPPQGMITQVATSPMHGSGLGLLVLPKGQTIQVLPSTIQPREMPKPTRAPNNAVQPPIQAQVTNPSATPKTALEIVINEIEAGKTEWYENGHARQGQEQEEEGDSKKKKKSKKMCIKVNQQLFFTKRHMPHFFAKKRNYQLPPKTLLDRFKKYLLWGKAKRK